MPERIPCKNPECKNTILPATARANDGLCAPCIGKIHEAEWEEHVRKNRRTVNPYDGIVDPVETIRIMLSPREHDPLIEYVPPPVSLEDAFANLTSAQKEKLVGIAAKAMKSGNKELSEDLGKALATLSDANLDPMLHAWLDKDCLWPGIAFRGAGAPICERIINSINQESVRIDHALKALAWIGNQRVQQKFAAWELQPPEWHQELHVGPCAYAQEGGWELEGTKRRNLFFNECFALVMTDNNQLDSQVHFLAETSNSCPWCGDILVHLIEIPTNVREFEFLQFDGTILPVLTCEKCTPYSGHLFARIQKNGKSQWHPSNTRPEYLQERGEEPFRGPWQGRTVMLKPRRAIHVADWCMEFPATQIGGMPTWVQDCAYPKCPDCSRTMMFMAQLDNMEFPNWEGIFYAFWCAACRVTATAYQQS